MSLLLFVITVIVTLVGVDSTTRNNQSRSTMKNTIFVVKNIVFALLIWTLVSSVVAQAPTGKTTQKAHPIYTSYTVVITFEQSCQLQLVNTSELRQDILNVLRADPKMPPIDSVTVANNGCFPVALSKYK